jgi:hypothetical protein
MNLAGFGFGDDTSMKPLPFVTALVDHDPLAAPVVVLEVDIGDDSRKGSDEEFGWATAGVIGAFGCSALKTFAVVMIG